MVSNKIQLLVSALIIMMFINTTASYSVTHNVAATSGNIFSPANISVSVGDTIKWTRTGGSHTTTCNGSEGSTRPSGAPAWNAPLTSASPTFIYVIQVAGMYHYVCEPHAPDMAGNINAVASSITQLTEIVRSYELSQNFPNPFNPVTNINFSIPNSSNVVLKVFNNMGQEIETLVNEKLNAGSYQVDWNAVNYTSGIYYYKIQTEGFIETRKMLLIK
ncbi:MAG: T9SS type A sorting domain-containing protein [Ignavibacteria bacterium]|nr:T9SS type A sorting domain-containing protein [Ignavibacteria bacterium]